MWPISLCIGALVTIAITHWVYRWRNPKCNGNLPPGSMGWPLIGETIQFFAPNRTWDIPYFLKEKMKRYGSIFRTSMVGLPVIVSSDSDLNRMVFQQEGQLFQIWYPDSMSKVFGRSDYLHGCMHKYLKNMVLKLFGPESLKMMIFEVESVATKNLERWAWQEAVELKKATADMILHVTAKRLISYDAAKSSMKLSENYEAFMRGLISFPLAIPGTAYHKCLQGRKKVMTILTNMVEERRAKPNKIKSDFIDYVLEELTQDDTTLTQAVAIDLMFLLLFASYETTSLALTTAIKLLTNHPQALEKLIEEHEEIVTKRKTPQSGVTWEEYKSMTFTFQIINETLRLANIVPGMFRKTLADIKFKDYTIPSGWVVMVCPPVVHVDPDNYKDPLDFNPWRWEGMGSKGASMNFMAFGGGMRFCVGADFARVQMAIFLHCLVTKYRWKLVKGGEIVRTPGLQFPNGFHVQIIKTDNENQDPTSESTSNPFD